MNRHRTNKCEEAKPSKPIDFPELSVEGNADDLKELGYHDQKAAEEFLSSIIHIMKMCVDLGWDVDIVQLMFAKQFRESANDNQQLKKGGKNE